MESKTSLGQTLQSWRQEAVAFLLEKTDSAFWILGAFLTVVFLLIAIPFEGQKGDIEYLRMALETSRALESLRNDLQNYLQEPDPQLRTAIGDKLIETEDNILLLSLGKVALKNYVARADLVSQESTNLPPALYRQFFDGPGKILDLGNELRQEVLRFLSHPSLEKLKGAQQTLDELDALLEQFTKVTTKEAESKVTYTSMLYTFFYPLSLAILVALKWILVDPLLVRLRQSLKEVERERRFVSLLLETAPVGIVLTRSDLTVERSNRRFREETGFEALEGEKNLLDLIPEEAQDALFVRIERLLEEGGSQTFEVPIHHSDGMRRDFLWRATKLADGRLLLSAADITERKQSEQALREAYLELERLHSELEQDLELAAHVQKAMLPSEEIQLPGLRGRAYLQTSAQVGGDYYDFYPAGASRSVVLIGDVTGHGVSAGMVVSSIKSAVLQLQARKISDPAEILSALNRTICNLAQSLKMTMLCLSLDAADGKLKIASAGHLPPMIRREGGSWEVLELPAQLQLGMDSGTDYRTGVVELELSLDDELALFTDGLIEAEHLGEPFGFERLEAVLGEVTDLPLEEQLQRLIEVWRGHLAGQPTEDDVTAILLHHHERVTPVVDLLGETSEVIRFPLERFRYGDHPPANIDRQHLVIEAEGDFSEWFDTFYREGIRRVLPLSHPLCQQLPQATLLRLSHNPEPFDDVGLLLPRAEVHAYTLVHTEDKPFVLEEVRSLVLDRTANDYLADRLTIALDEMVENAFYAAPRDPKGRPLYRKGEERSLQGEEVEITIARQNGLWAVQVVDKWGTLRPEELFYFIARAHKRGVLPGEGRLGLYTIWQMADYFQIRIYPGCKTVTLTLWCEDSEETVAGIQCFVHPKITEIEEQEISDVQHV